MHVVNNALSKPYKPFTNHCQETSDDKIDEEDEGKLSQTIDSDGVMPCPMRSGSMSSRVKGTLAGSAVLLSDHLRRPWAVP
jgi:hypothetical protein